MRCVRILVLPFLVLAGCGDEAVRRTAPTAEERFAREYLRILQDSGVAAILPRTKSTTRTLPNFETNMASLRSALTGARWDSLALTEWEVERSSDRPAAAELVYALHGLGRPFEIGMWIEQENGRPVVETIRFGPPRS